MSTYVPADFIDLVITATIWDRGRGDYYPEFALVTDPSRFRVFVTGEPQAPLIFWEIAGADRISTPLPPLGEEHTYRFVYAPSSGENRIYIDDVLMVSGYALSRLGISEGRIETNQLVRMTMPPKWKGTWSINQGHGSYGNGKARRILVGTAVVAGILGLSRLLGQKRG